MATEIVDRPEAGRFELVVDGEVAGVAEYHARGDVVVVPHTEIAVARRGQGLGAVLVAGVLDELRRRGALVVPQCWYVAEFIGAHPAYADLVAP